MNTRRSWQGLLLGIALFAAASNARAMVVVIAPHPDDGEASCGGLIANTVAAGESVVVLEMTGGELDPVELTEETDHADA